MGERNFAEEVGYLVAVLEQLAEDGGEDARTWLARYRQHYRLP